MIRNKYKSQPNFAEIAKNYFPVAHVNKLLKEQKEVIS